MIRNQTYVFLAVTMTSSMVFAAMLEVGPDKMFARIEEANEKAEAGDTILVYPREGNAAYDKVAVFVRRSNLTFKAVRDGDNDWVPLSGAGFDYSGQGEVPRAIFQFNKGSDNCVLEGFELSGAHNGSHNGAGVRINQANQVLIRNCRIHGNDMGIMSNGDGSSGSASDQIIEYCMIFGNGSYEAVGYNHNLYLGGSSVMVRHCEIYRSLTGHNIKSRAHYTRVQYCYVHDSANREFDLVDSVDTEKPGSHAVLMGNVIVKDSGCEGNKTVIHFGQDSKLEHDGTIYLIHNTIVTPFVAPVVELSAAKAKAVFLGNFVCDSGMVQSGQTVVEGRAPGKESNASGVYNWFDRGFIKPGETELSPRDNYYGNHITDPFINPAAHNFRLVNQIRKGARIKDSDIPAWPGVTSLREFPLEWQYAHPASRQKRPREVKPAIGAYGQ